MKVLRWTLAAMCAGATGGIVLTGLDSLVHSFNYPYIDSILVGSLLAAVMIFSLVMPAESRSEFWKWVGARPGVVLGVGGVMTFAGLVKAAFVHAYDPLTVVWAGMVVYGAFRVWGKQGQAGTEGESSTEVESKK